MEYGAKASYLRKRNETQESRGFGRRLDEDQFQSERRTELKLKYSKDKQILCRTKEAWRSKG